MKAFLRAPPTRLPSDIHVYTPVSPVDSPMGSRGAPFPGLVTTRLIPRLPPEGSATDGMIQCRVGESKHAAKRRGESPTRVYEFLPSAADELSDNILKNISSQQGPAPHTPHPVMVVKFNSSIGGVSFFRRAGA